MLCSYCSNHSGRINHGRLPPLLDSYQPRSIRMPCAQFLTNPRSDWSHSALSRSFIGLTIQTTDRHHAPFPPTVTTVSCTCTAFCASEPNRRRSLPPCTMMCGPGIGLLRASVAGLLHCAACGYRGPATLREWDQSDCSRERVGRSRRAG